MNKTFFDSLSKEDQNKLLAYQYEQHHVSDVESFRVNFRHAICYNRTKEGASYWLTRFEFWEAANMLNTSTDCTTSDHYKMPIDPDEYSSKNGLSFRVGNIVKYVSRYPRKGKDKDLVKAIDYCTRLLKDEYNYSKGDALKSFENILNKLY